MDMGIVNAGALVVYDEVDAELRERIEDVILNRGPTPPSGCWRSPSDFAGAGEAVEAADRRVARAAGAASGSPTPW